MENEFIQKFGYAEMYEWANPTLVPNRLGIFVQFDKDNPEKIVLDYQISESNTFIPYFRGLDMGKKMTNQEHNRIMDEECSKL